MRLLVLLILGLLISSGCEPPLAKRTAVPDKPFIVYDFWAEWCGPCKMFAPTFEEVQTRLEKRSDVAFVRVNVDEDRQLAAKFEIEFIPTVIVTANGKEVTRFSGGQYINMPEAFERRLLEVLR